MGNNFCFQWHGGFFQIFSTCTSKGRQPVSKLPSCAQWGTPETPFWRCNVALNAPQLLITPSQPGCSYKDSSIRANMSQISSNTRSLQPHRFQSLLYAMQDEAPASMLCHSWKEPCKMQLNNPYARIIRNGLSKQSALLLRALCSNTTLDVGGVRNIACALGKSNLGVTQSCFWLSVFRDMGRRS